MNNNTLKSPKNKKPAPFIAPGSEIPVTPEELERRKRKRQRLEKLGIDPTKIVDDGESENPYLVEAMVYISQDKDVPEEILRKIKQYDEEHK